MTLRNSLLVQLKNTWIEATDPTSISDHRRRETMLALGAYTDQNTVATICDRVLAIYAHPREQITVGVDSHLDVTKAYPFYRSGDFNTVLDSTEAEVLEDVISVTITVANRTGRSTETVVVKDQIQELDEEYIVSIQKMANGVLIGSAYVGAQPAVNELVVASKSIPSVAQPPSPPPPPADWEQVGTMDTLMDVDLDGCRSVFATLGGQMLLIGGGADCSNGTEMFEFDASTDTPTPTTAYSGSGDILYSIGDDAGTVYVVAKSGATPYFYKYNGGTWTALTAPPTLASIYPSLVLMGGYIYMLDVSGSAGQTWQRYNIAGDSWAYRADIPSSYGYGCETIVADSVNGVIWYFGPASHKYTPGSDTWSASAATAPPQTRTFATIAYNGRNVYLIAGTDQIAFDHPNPGDVFDLDALTWSLMEDDFPLASTCGVSGRGLSDGSAVYVNDTWNFYPTMLWKHALPN